MNYLNQLTKQHSIFSYEELPRILQLIDIVTVKNNKKIEYINLPLAFDIETSSFYENGQKRAIMYEWTLGVCGYVFYGRTWEEFSKAYNELVRYFEPHKERRLVIYVHNLAYEFQWLRFRFLWAKIFATDERKPIYAVTSDYVEFKCSYFLSGYSLETLGKNLTRYKVYKASGMLDYSLIRTPATPLTDEELFYCECDVRVVMAYIQEKIEDYHGICNVQLTKTGEVRKFCRSMCFYDKTSKLNNWKKWTAYHRLMAALTLDKPSYMQLKRAFGGGFTHASILKTYKVYHNVGSIDFASAYPAEALKNKFPMSSPKTVQVKTREEFDYYVQNYCCIFNVTFKKLIATTMIEHPISSSRCWNLEGAVYDNGRIVSAECISLTMTEVDYKLYKKFYTWEWSNVSEFTIYEKAYLPKDLMLSILELYQKKTTLKGVKGEEADYVHAKQLLNSVYGCMVTDIARPDIQYSGDWATVEADVDKQIASYNKSKNRFLFYAWGVYITSYCRSDLLNMILKIGYDYIYSDTDSIKMLNYEDHVAEIDEYNRECTEAINKALRKQGIDPELSRPKTPKGEAKQIGVFEYEGEYIRFKTIGAKRYMVETEDGLSLTVSGLNKKITIPYMMKKYKTSDACFDAFSDELYIPAGETGKNTHTYIDHETAGTVTDFCGQEYTYHEYSSVHIEAADYSLSIPYSYMQLIRKVNQQHEL